MQVGEANVQLEFDTKYNLATASGVVVLVQHTTHEEVARSLACVIAEQIARRSTLVTDFPYSGNYKFQLIATWAGGRVLKSEIGEISVKSSLKAPA